MSDKWKNRIVNHGEQSAKLFKANILNWRLHPQAQKNALSEVLSEIGWVQSVIVNKTTGNVVDGHARIEQALKLGDDTPVPFIEVELTEEEEKKILLTFDPISTMASVDSDNLNTLLSDIKVHSAELDNILLDLSVSSADKKILNFEKDLLDIKQKEITKIELSNKAIDILFPSDNEWDIPKLLPQAPIAGLPMPCDRWGRSARGSFNGGTLHFYTEDYRFEAIWKAPEKIIQSQCKAIIEPNVSTGHTTPRSFALWGVYRKRWISRWVQQYGVAVFVDLNVDPKFRDINLLGVPRGWMHYATRSYESHTELLDLDYESACAHADGNNILFVVVGGGKATHNKCIERGWVHIPQENHVVAGYYPDK